ncbi:phenylalanine--tRNA ligase subunit beta [Candidatus Woesearchaeota archaeon]|nr:phenylalanine--tRNA ligase subunit beta [Candidatus Woesearchaeota archaeon]
MVILETKYSLLNSLLGKKINEKELEETLFEMGYELESITGDELRVDITAERPDLLSTYGLARAIRAYFGMKNEKYKLKESGLVVNVTGAAKEWSYAVACVVKGLKFDDGRIKEVIRIQEKLGATLLRNRRKGGLGLYPLNKIKFPVTYTSEEPGKIRFKPLEGQQIMSGSQILERHPTGRTYKHLIENWKRFPLFKDAVGQILSMPPIINSHELGKIDETTKDVFVECTGTELKTINLALSILVGALIDMGGEASALKMKYGAKTIVSPEFKEEVQGLEVKKVNRLLGLELSAEKIKKLLEKSMYEVKSFNKERLEVIVPPLRSDIWHEVDLIDDVARGYGFNDFELRMKSVESTGETTLAVKLKEELAGLLVGLGYQEAFTLMLTSKQDQFEKMKVKEAKHIQLGKSVEGSINMLRCWLLPELMKALTYNQSAEYPHKLFEISQVTLFDEKAEVKSKETLRLAVVCSNASANFTEIKQVLDYLLSVIGMEYTIEETEHGSFIPGRVGRVMAKGRPVAYLGEIKPEVLAAWGLEMPACALEMDLAELFGL